MNPQSANDRDDGPRILVVEDTLIVAAEIARMLREAGCSVVGPWSTLTQALQAADDERIDGAVLDVNLHGLSVFPVADRLVERQIPLVFLTGYSAQSLPATYRGLPCLEKPFTHEEFVRALEDALGCSLT